MLDLIYLSIIFIALGLVIMIVYLCFILHRVTKMLQSLSTSFAALEKQVHYITPELTETLRETDGTIEDTKEKLQATDSLFDRFDDLGTSLQNVNTTFQQRFGTRLTDEEMDRKVKPFIEAIRWSEVGATLYKDYQKTKTDETI